MTAYKEFGDTLVLPGQLEEKYPGKSATLRRLWKEASGYDPLEEEKKSNEYWRVYGSSIQPLRRASNICFVIGFLAAIGSLWLMSVSPSSTLLLPVLLSGASFFIASFPLHIASVRADWKSGKETGAHAAYERASDFMAMVSELMAFLSLEIGPLLSLSEEQLRERVAETLIGFSLEAQRHMGTKLSHMHVRERYDKAAKEYGYFDRRYKTFARFDLVDLKGTYDSIAAQRLATPV